MENRVPLAVIVRTATLERLRAEASAAAAERGLDANDLEYGTFVAEHVSGALEDAYRACPEVVESVPASDAELCFMGTSLPPDVARELRTCADAEADRQGVGSAESEREDFASAYIGRRLDDSYRQRVDGTR